ncbi:MAG: hypothetical protein IK094_00165 [Treponema sp.]|nr:hypothetical protein [Treponema sp.]
MTKEELEKKIESYCSRITYLNDCFELHKLMISSQKEHLEEINEFLAFYQLAKKSFLYVCIIELAKLYEYGSESGIKKLIDICDANHNLFLKKFQNEIIECETGKVGRSYDIRVDIKKDIAEAKEKLINLVSVVKKLKGQRDKFYAHLDKEYQDEPTALSNDYPLNYGEIKQLIDAATNICNTFYQDLCTTSHACQTSNWDDINNVFKMIKEWKEMKHKEFERQVEDGRKREAK